MSSQGLLAVLLDEGDDSQEVRLPVPRGSCLRAALWRLQGKPCQLVGRFTPHCLARGLVGPATLDGSGCAWAALGMDQWLLMEQCPLVRIATWHPLIHRDFTIPKHITSYRLCAHIVWGINERSQRHVRMSAELWSYWHHRCGGVAPVTGKLEWRVQAP